VKDVHLIVGVAAIAANALATVLGAWCWWRSSSKPWFWRVLRGGQALVVIQAALGGVLLALHYKPHHLHVLYGLLPLLISFLAEQFRVSSAQMVLDRHGLQSAREVGELPEAQQHALVRAIIRRELGVMTLGALVVVVLLARAAQTAG
jgi:hypothetical protein